MKRRVIRRSFAVVVPLGVSLSEGHRALAYDCTATGWSCWYGDNAVQINEVWNPYNRPRYLAYPSYGIAIKRETGPSILAGTWDCVHGGTDGSTISNITSARDTNWHLLKANTTTQSSLYFCLTFDGYNGSTGYMTGEFNWDGYYA